MIKKSEKTYYANIYMGLKRGYDGDNIRLDEIADYINLFINKNKIGCTTTDTFFQYPGGEEEGVCIGLINYPRYPKGPEGTREVAEAMVENLLEIFEQERITVVYPDETIMYERENEDNNSGK